MKPIGKRSRRTLLADAQELLSRRLEQALEAPEKESLVACSRALEIVHKVHRGYDGGGPVDDARSFADRLEWLAEVGEELRRRGLLRKSAERLPERVLDGEALRTDAR